MPMKTRLVRASSKSSRSERTCPVISPGRRSRLNPPRPLAQKAQPNLQPTWVETQTVRRAPEGMHNGLDELAVLQAEQRLAHAVRRLQDVRGVETAEGEPLRHPLAQLAGEVRELVEAGGPFAVDPGESLDGPEGRLAQAPHLRSELFERQVADVGHVLTGCWS